MEKKLAIIILNWNGIAETQQCVQSLADSSFQDFDLVLFDNGSANNEIATLKKLADYRTTVWHSPINLGFAAGNNVVIQKLRDAERKYSYYLFLNQDVIVKNHTLSDLFYLMEKHSDVAVCGPLVLSPNGRVQSLGADINLRNGKIISRFQNTPNDDRIPATPHDVSCILGNCFFVRQTMWRDVGSFDERYFAYYEEADWCMRAHEKKLRCVIVPQAKITHAKSGGFRTYLITRNMIWFEKKWASRTQLFYFFFSFWFHYIPERLRKGSPLGELLRGAKDGWLMTK